MKKCILGLVFGLVFLLFPGVLLYAALPAEYPGQLPDETLERLTTQLDSMDIGKYNIDLNVKVKIPALKAPDAGVNGNPGDMKHAPVDLWAIVLRPMPVKPRPTILISTCYRREVCLILGASLVSHGYNVMVLDIRGSGSAAGQWQLFDLEEHTDIAYVIDKWIPDESNSGWSNGDVGMIGPSYLAITQFLAAGNIERDEQGRPAHLKAIFPVVPLADVYGDLAMSGGNASIEFILLWLGISDGLGILPPLQLLGSSSMEDVEEALDVWTQHIQAIGGHIRTVMDPAQMTYSQFYRRNSAMMYWPDAPDNWVEWERKRMPADLPVFMTGAWYCIFTRDEGLIYEHALSGQEASDKAMVIGPWYHADGSFNLGIEGLMLSNEVSARWFDWKIKGIEDPFMVKYPVVLYVMGEDRWRAEKSWPLPAERVENRTYYLSRTRADDIQGDWFSGLNRKNNYLLKNALDIDDSVPYSVFDMDKNNPILMHEPPVFHGIVSRSSVRWSIGVGAIVSQASRYLLGTDMDPLMPWEDERLDDVGVLTFTTDELEEDVEISGPLKLTFWAKTEFHRPVTEAIADKACDLLDTFWAGISQSETGENLLTGMMNKKDVQWVIGIEDVFCRGRAKNITSGWLSAAHRPYNAQGDRHDVDPEYTPFNPFYKAPDIMPDPINPGDLYEYVVEIWPTDNRFKAGHRIRLSISASDVPHLLPILHPSRNTIVIDNQHPATLEFAQVTSDGDWKWITPEKGSIKEEFDSVNNYLLNHRDEDAAMQDASSGDGEEAAPEGADDTTSTAAATQSQDSSGACFIRSAMI